ncbi:CYTH domain-containing protein [Virgibacillus doumboii]|uniref:CYTH domain-containing protein n=1 Tax=Virgibacillus doumboii TaxID=2697503 RepID=UPI0013DEDA91|nr:CYTH domain-containing protein [Virgibacillus doumboii]
MAQEIEIEYKNLLTESEFNRVLDSLPFPEETQTQTNHYFETADFSLKENGCALRIREKNGIFTLTLKEPHDTGLLETHDTLSEQEAHDWITGRFVPKKHTSKQLAAKDISLDDLTYLGSLVTDRRELKYDNVLLVLDYSTYNGTSDFELEMEAASEEIGREAMRKVLEKFSIEKRQTPNKIQRFFESKNGSVDS